MFGVDRHDLARFGGLDHQRTARHQRFLVGQGQPGAAVQRGQGGVQAQRAHQRVEHHVRLGVLHQPGGRLGSGIGDVADPRHGFVIGDGDVGDPGLSALVGEQVRVAAARGQPDHLEAVPVGGDDLQGLGTDRPGATEDQYPQPVAHGPIVPRSWVLNPAGHRDRTRAVIGRSQPSVQFRRKSAQEMTQI